VRQGGAQRERAQDAFAQLSSGSELIATTNVIVALSKEKIALVLSFLFTVKYRGHVYPISES
jgi:hypothetical protein